MTGYVLAVNYMGSAVGAVASAVYPAIGTALACLFLKERVTWYQWGFLALTILGVFGLSYSPQLNVENFWLGLLGALMCAFGWGIEAVILPEGNAAEVACLQGIRVYPARHLRQVVMPSSSLAAARSA